MVKKELARLTIDFPSELHKKIKSHAALQGVSCRKIIVQLVARYLELYDSQKENDEQG